MPCEWLKGPNGEVIHINRRRSGKKRLCKFCGSKYSDGKLCDFPVRNGKTCDAEMCSNCARTLGRQNTEFAPGFTRLNDTIDVCPIHRGQAIVEDGKIRSEA